MADLETRKRKAKFNPRELEVLVDEANKHLNNLQQKNLTLAQRTNIWEKICAKVNAVGKTRRTVDEVKRRYQDIRRRTKEKLEAHKTTASETSGSTVEDIALTSIEEKVQVMLDNEDAAEDQVTEMSSYDIVDIKVEQESSSEVLPPAPNSPEAAATPSEPPKSAEEINREFLREQTKQSAALQTIAREMRAASSLAQAVRRDTQAIAVHCRQMVNAVSALTMAVNSVARGLQAMAALHPGAEVDGSNPTATGEGGEMHTAGKFHLRKRKRLTGTFKKRAK